MRLMQFIPRHRSFIVVWPAVLISIASQVPLMPVAGRLSDRFGKKLFLSSGLLMYAMAVAGVSLIPWAGGFVGIRRAHWMKSM